MTKITNTHGIESIVSPKRAKEMVDAGEATIIADENAAKKQETKGKVAANKEEKVEKTAEPKAEKATKSAAKKK